MVESTFSVDRVAVGSSLLEAVIWTLVGEGRDWGKSQNLKEVIGWL
jgi:hypothetical protein